LKTVILTTRLRRYFLIRDEDHTYYGSELRSADLDMHALDRGLRRLPGENDAALLDRISTLAFRNQFLGTKAGMKYLVEEIYGLTCEQIVEYYVDDQSWIVLSAEDQAGEAEVNISRIFSADDVDIYEAYRQTRIYSEDDLSLAFHFWMHVSFPQGLNVDQQVVMTIHKAVRTAKRACFINYWPSSPACPGTADRGRKASLSSSLRKTGCSPFLRLVT